MVESIRSELETGSEQKTEIIWRPNPRQKALIECPVPDRLFGGARGGGKSIGCIGHWIYKSNKYGAGARGLFLRRTYDELAEIERYCDLYLSRLGGRWRAMKRTWVMPNGATLMLRFLDKDIDAEHFMGFSLTDVYIDEAGNFPSPAPIDLLRGSLRSATGVPCQMTLTANPGGAGHLWLQNRYVKPSPPMRPFYDHMAKTWRVFIPSLLDDNPDLLLNDPGYKDRLASSAIGKPWLLLAWLRGDWNASPQGGMLQLDWFKRFTAPPANIIRLIQSWDTAQTKKEGSCPWAGLTIAETLDGYYLVDLYSNKHIYPEGKRQVRSLALKWRPQTVLIENKSSGIDLINELRENFWGEGNEHPGFTPNILPIQPEGDKVKRLAVESDTIESGRLWLPEVAAWLPEFEAKVTAYPKSGMDEVDALSQALKYFRTHPIVNQGDSFSIGQTRTSYRLARDYSSGGGYSGYR